MQQVELMTQDKWPLQEVLANLEKKMKATVCKKEGEDTGMLYSSYKLPIFIMLQICI